MKKFKNNLKIDIYKNLTQTNFLLIEKKEKLNKQKFFTRLVATKLDFLNTFESIRFKFPLTYRIFNLLDDLKVYIVKKKRKDIVFIKFINYIIFKNIKLNILKLENKINYNKLNLYCSSINFLRLFKI